MTVTTEEKTATNLLDTTQTVEEYVKEQFPKGIGESVVKYCSVGENRFRINFYTTMNPGSFCSDNRITRSHYVICTKVADGWEHRIWRDRDIVPEGEKQYPI